jgi:hypothetical protein
MSKNNKDHNKNSNEKSEFLTALKEVKKFIKENKEFKKFIENHKKELIDLFNLFQTTPNNQNKNTKNTIKKCIILALGILLVYKCNHPSPSSSNRETHKINEQKKNEQEKNDSPLTTDTCQYQEIPLVGNPPDISPLKYNNGYNNTPKMISQTNVTLGKYQQLEESRELKIHKLNLNPIAKFKSDYNKALSKINNTPALKDLLQPEDIAINHILPLIIKES